MGHFQIRGLFWGTVFGETRFTEPRFVVAVVNIDNFGCRINETLELKNDFYSR